VAWSVDECLRVVRGNLGEGFDHLCSIESLEVYKYPVLGWVVLVSSIRLPTGQRMKVVKVKPVFLLFSGFTSRRRAETITSLGSAPDEENLGTMLYEAELDEGDEVAGVLPPWPNTYYVTGQVNGVAFDLGVHINPNDEELKKLLLEAYLKWLGERDTRKHKHKLAKPKTEPGHGTGDGTGSKT
jgi:hypothetical protein